MERDGGEVCMTKARVDKEKGDLSESGSGHPCTATIDIGDFRVQSSEAFHLVQFITTTPTLIGAQRPSNVGQGNTVANEHR